MPMNKKPCVVAGLMATLGLGATLVVMPSVAFAETQAIDEIVPQAISIGDKSDSDVPEVHAVVGGSWSDVTKTEEGGHSAALEPPIAAGDSADSSITTDSIVEAEDLLTNEMNQSDSSCTAKEDDCSVEIADDVLDDDFQASVSEVANGESFYENSNPSVPSNASKGEAETESQVSCDSSYSTGWNLIDGLWYWYDKGSQEARKGWFVTSTAPGIAGATSGELERYWLDKITGALAVGRLIDPEADGSGYWAYATETGAVVRGKYDTGEGYVYVADNEGALACAANKAPGESGWRATKDYDDEAQRYWIDGETHAARTGFFTVDGRLYYGVPGEGYVLRGGGVVELGDGSGARAWANNDGVVSTSGWVVTGDFTGGELERYWAQEDGSFAVGRLIDPEADGSGYWAYATETGAVVRGKYDTGEGYVYVADNEGALACAANKAPGESGWLVTTRYDDEAQRYWIDGETHAARTGFFKIENSVYYGVADEGYVLRGKLKMGSHTMLLADNDGVFVSSQGSSLSAKTNTDTYAGNWLVTKIYDKENQRYFIIEVPGKSGVYGALLGEFSVGEDDYFGREDQGYVVRGLYVAPSGKAYYGDNDGVLGDLPLSQVAINLWNRIKNTYSATQYLIAVDCDNCHTVVFQGSAGNWTPIFDWLCGVGLPQYNNGQGTIRGEWTIGGDNSYCNWTDDPDFSEWGDPYTWQTTYFAKDDIKWYTNFCLDLGFHSTIGWDGGYSDPNQIGKKISHGCIRLLEENAKWIYYNAGYGTKVVTV